MRPNTLKRTLQAGGTALNAWLSIPSSFSAEVVASCGVDAVTVDMQHGMIDFAQALAMFQAISSTTAVPIGRPTGSNPVEIMRLLDAGAYGVICPQVDTPEIAEAVVSACRYPPVGTRSFGPPRGVLYGGADYFAHANEEILVLIMIESRLAVSNLDKILDVKGIDGVFIGPNDLSLSYGGGPGCDPQGEAAEAMETIRQKAADRGLATGIFCSDIDMCHRRIEQGFQLVNAANDGAMLKNGYVSQVNKLKGSGTGSSGKTGY